MSESEAQCSRMFMSPLPDVCRHDTQLTDQTFEDNLFAPFDNFKGFFRLSKVFFAPHRKTQMSILTRSSYRIAIDEPRVRYLFDYASLRLKS
jgi:hypothetical protein